MKLVHPIVGLHPPSLVPNYSSSPAFPDRQLRYIQDNRDIGQTVRQMGCRNGKKTKTKNPAAVASRSKGLKTMLSTQGPDRLKGGWALPPLPPW